MGLTLAALVGVTALVLANATSSPYEITRVRNSLIAQVGTPADFDWTPSTAPTGYLQESGEVPPELAEGARRVVEAARPGASVWQHALLLGEHLAEGPGVGGGILTDTVGAYRTIMTEPRGFCSDYSQVFNGLSFASGIPVREWGMSFDGFNGDGHAFNEIYDERSGRWIFIDSFFSLYAVDAATGQPLSVLDFHERLSQSDAAKPFRIEPLVPERFGFRSPEHAAQYYRNGAEQFFLFFGNNVLSYDAHPAVELVAPISRALEQIVAIVVGVNPEIRIVPTATNAGEIERLFALRNAYLLAAAVAALLGLLLVLQVVMLWRGRVGVPRSP